MVTSICLTGTHHDAASLPHHEGHQRRRRAQRRRALRTFGALPRRISLLRSHGGCPSLPPPETAEGPRPPSLPPPPGSSRRSPKGRRGPPPPGNAPRPPPRVSHPGGGGA